MNDPYEILDQAWEDLSEPDKQKFLSGEAYKSIKMNKKYFCKYLPVEGEKINIGEKYINMNFHLTKPYEKGGSCYGGYPTIGNRVVETRKKDQTSDSAFSGNKYANKNYIKAKLFLCSRDIQVGDKLTFLNGAGEEAVTHFNAHDKPVCGKYVVNEEQAVKVVGEISPEALSYVHEGDEFASDEVELWLKETYQKASQLIPGIPHAEIMKQYDPKRYEKMIHVYKIKGPCSHFH